MLFKSPRFTKDQKNNILESSYLLPPIAVLGAFENGLPFDSKAVYGLDKEEGFIR